MTTHSIDTLFSPALPFVMREIKDAQIEDFGVRGNGYGARVSFVDGSHGTVYWDSNGKHTAGAQAFDLINIMASEVTGKAIPAGAIKDALRAARDSLSRTRITLNVSISATHLSNLLKLAELSLEGTARDRRFARRSEMRDDGKAINVLATKVRAANDTIAELQARAAAGPSAVLQASETKLRKTLIETSKALQYADQQIRKSL